MQATNCRIHGSELVQRLQLDRRFCIYFQTRLTWEAAARPLQSSSSQNGAPHAAATDIRMSDDPHAEGHAANSGGFGLPQISWPFQSKPADSASQGCVKVLSPACYGALSSWSQLAVCLPTMIRNRPASATFACSRLCEEAAASVHSQAQFRLAHHLLSVAQSNSY